MGKRTIKDPEDDVIVVVLIDPLVRNLPGFGCEIENRLREQFSEAGQLKVCYRGSDWTDAPTIQWITRIRGQPRTEWKLERFVLLFESAATFDVKFRSTSSPEQLLCRLFGRDKRQTEGRKVKVLVFEDGKQKGGRCNGVDKQVAMERRQLESRKLSELAVECQVLHDVDMAFGCKPEDCLLEVTRSSKSIVEMRADQSKPFVDGQTSWYPRKVGPTVAVSKSDSHFGLLLLWQKHLTQISKRLGIEQAKVIASDPDFSSPRNCMETYQSSRDGEQLLNGKRVRPSGTSSDILGLGSGPSIGQDVSKKVHKMMTTQDGDSYP